MRAENDSNINGRLSLGKGEVLSSILSGSTTKPIFSSTSCTLDQAYPAVSGRTEREEAVSIRGKSVDSVPVAFTEDHMDFDITTVRKLTGLRNRPGLAFHLKERLTTLLNTAEEINKTADDDPHREKLLASFKRQWKEYEEASAG